MESLISEEAICKKDEILFSENPSLTYLQVRVEDCKALHQRRLQQYLDVKLDYDKAVQDDDTLKVQAESLKNLNETIKSAYDLLVTNVKKGN